jgi:hypothetical protein
VWEWFLLDLGDFNDIPVFFVDIVHCIVLITTVRGYQVRGRPAAINCRGDVTLALGKHGKYSPQRIQILVRRFIRNTQPIFLFEVSLYAYDQ